VLQNVAMMITSSRILSIAQTERERGSVIKLLPRVAALGRLLNQLIKLSRFQYILFTSNQCVTPLVHFLDAVPSSDRV
jgi:hypothetical protein